MRQAGTKNCGTITKLFYSANEIKWQGMKPYFIEVTFDSGEVVLAHPSQLTKKL